MTRPRGLGRVPESELTQERWTSRRARAATSSTPPLRSQRQDRPARDSAIVSWHATVMGTRQPVSQSARKIDGEWKLVDVTN